MIHKNIWKPDTCKCEIEYEWDDTTTEENRIHNVSRIIKVCDAHKGLSDKVQNYDIVLKENQRKNYLYKHILDDVPTVIQKKIQEDGSVVKYLKPGLEYNWSFDKDRNLVVDLMGFTAQQKNAISIIANSLYGNKVIIK